MTVGELILRLCDWDRTMLVKIMDWSEEYAPPTPHIRLVPSDDETVLYLTVDHDATNRALDEEANTQ